MDIYLREIQRKDLEDYLKFNHPSAEFHKFNGPYYRKNTQQELEKYVEEISYKLMRKKENPLGNKKIIADKKTDTIIGEVNWYWKSEETLWLEVGIVIFDSNFWKKGIGYDAMILWIDEMFQKHPKIIRIGLTTWSGNIGMMKLAEKLGLKKEAVYRKARIYNGKYYDSVSYGILKQEWKKI